MAFTLVLALLLFVPSPALAFMADDEIAAVQAETKSLSPGERIALWAERFVGVPYDTDPLGEYVTKEAIVADERVDCMYLAFRSVELALGGSPEEAVLIALEKRFLTRGIINGGLVANYGERYQYAEDMLDGGRWGAEVTSALAETVEIEGSRGRDKVRIIPKGSQTLFNGLQSGDIVFFVKAPEKRIVGEIVGHLGIIKVDGGGVFLIHASGKKSSDAAGGQVKKVLFADYVASMPFAGVRVSRF
jgi:hypothetical protein